MGLSYRWKMLFSPCQGLRYTEKSFSSRFYLPEIRFITRNAQRFISTFTKKWFSLKERGLRKTNWEKPLRPSSRNIYSFTIEDSKHFLCIVCVVPIWLCFYFLFFWFPVQLLWQWWKDHSWSIVAVPALLKSLCWNEEISSTTHQEMHTWWDP